MFSRGELLDMIATEAIEPGGVCGERTRESYVPLDHHSSDLPPIRYTLRLVRREDGILDWVD